MKIINQLGKVLLPVLVAAFLVSPVNAKASATAPVITLERAKEMARSQGVDLKLLELGQQQAQVSLDLTRREYGLGAVGIYDSETLKREIDSLEAHIEERRAAIRLLEESIEEWKKEKEQLKPADPEYAALEEKIDRAYRDIADYQSEIDEIAPVRGQLVPRYYQLKAQEEQVKPLLEPAEDALKATSDALELQPKILDYQVENIYLSLLSLGRQREYQAMVLENLEKMLAREKFKLEIGLSTSLLLSQVEAKLRQVEEAIFNLEVRENSLKRAFNRLVGLPPDFVFQLAPVDLILIPYRAYEGFPPDLTGSVNYRRALSNLEKRKRDLEDTSEFDTRKYELAELKVKEAELELEKTLQELKANYLDKADKYKLAEEEMENAKVNLEDASQFFAKMELKHELGAISRAELEQQELSLAEAELNCWLAKQQLHLSRQAYLLAREGIKVE